MSGDGIGARAIPGETAGYLVVETTRDHARAFARYAYAPPYDLYDAPEDAETGFLDPEARYVSIVEGDALVGFACFGIDARVAGSGCGDDEPNVLDVGIGMDPDRVGRGDGARFLQAVLAHVRRHHAATTIRATIADFNTRSIALVTRAGFSRTETFTRAADGRSFGIYEREV